MSFQFLAVLVLCAGIVSAGGPLNPDFSGGVVRWDPARPVPFVFDGGPLSEQISGEQGAALVRQLLETWEDVETCSIRFEDRGFLSEDINAGNFEQYLEQGSPAGNPVVFDADGRIVDAVFGAGSSNSVLGFAASFPEDSQDSFYDFGFAVLNGKRANVGNPTHIFRKTVLHELGHLLGLDHTQAGMRFFNSGLSSVVPIMYPFITVGTPDLEQDDIAWISYLYPDQGFDQFGAISGRVGRRSGGPFLSANVEAVPVLVGTDGTIQELEQGFVSVVSDYLACLDGSFLIPGLPSGDYVVFIEPLNPSFTGGSDVGPHPFRFTNFPKDYFNGEDESGENTDDPGAKVVVALDVAHAVPGIQFVSNEGANLLASLGDDDEELFEFPDGFAFPFFGKLYREISVNSDGNLTFVGGDSASTPRDLERFLSGFPRIAPLFTDLDPSSGGSIAADYDGEKLTFSWTGVPEFDRLDGQTNDFSVTLFPNGDILFHYDNVAVLPDDPLENLQLIVGLSPGGSRGSEMCAPVQPAEADSFDFSSVPGPVMITNRGLAEAFPGASFDLTGVGLLFQAGTSPQFYMSFPQLEGNQDDFTGFAVSNDSGNAAVLEIEARSPSGALQPYHVNPRVRALDSPEQFAEVGFALFGESPENPRDGWVRIGSDHPGLASFFQLGNGLQDGLVTQLDGSVAFTEQSTLLYFTRVLDGENLGLTPSGGIPVDAVTVLSLANPNDVPVRLEFTLLGKSGLELVSGVRRDLPALGSLRESIPSLFGPLGPITDGFVRVQVTQGPGAVGFELVRLEDSLLGLNASFGNSGNRSYSAQLAHGQAGSVGIFTSLKLVNVSSSLRAVTITGFRDDGTILGLLSNIILQPNQSFQQSIGQIFNLGPTVSPAVTGSIRIDADGPGVIGDVVFGDSERLRYAAALPLQTATFSKAVFSQVANLIGPDLRKSTFTGLAFYNPNSEAAEITVRVFSKAGSPSGVHTIQLEPGKRISEVLAVLIPSTAGQVQGFILIQSDQPIVAQQLFGNPTLDYLSAVPPSAFE